MSLQRRFWLLAALRWLPTGFIVPVAALLPLQRGLSIAEYGRVAAVQGIVVLLLELPTGGFADALGRKPVFLASAAVAVASYLTSSMANSVAGFAVAIGLAGVFRALDSGPLNAWFVDAVHDNPSVTEPSPVIARGLSGYSSIVGVSIAAGSVLSGGLIAWLPVDRGTAMTVPYLVAASLACVQILVATLVMHEDCSERRGGLLASIRTTPTTVLAGLHLMWRSRVLRALVAVELFWGYGMVAFESFTPIRMADLLDDRDLAAAVMGPVTAAAWGVSALGAAAVPFLLRHWSMVSVSVALRLLQGATVVGMGLAAGPVGLVVGFFATYAVHSVAGAIYETLLHEQVGKQNRATVLSLASMAMQPAGSLAAITLGALATGYSTGTAVVVGGVVLALAAPLFLVRDPVSAEAGPGARSAVR